MTKTDEGSGLEDTARRWLFWVGVVFTISAPIIIGIEFANTGIAWVAALCGAFVTFISKLHEMAELSVGPVRAKMRETIREANATIDQVRNIARNISETTLTALMAGNFGFTDGLNLRSRLDLHDRLIESLKEIGVPDNEISELDEKWNQGIGVIYYRAIAPLIDGREDPNQINMNASEEQIEQRKGWDGLLEFDEWKAPTPDEMQAYMDAQGIVSEGINEWVEDYRNFLEIGEIRRREIFVTK